jgi:glutamate 5-kinase
LKIGSRSLSETGAGNRFEAVAGQIAEQVKAKREVVLVSSGAVAFGRKRLGMKERPKTVPKLQAAAAAGQSALMRAYEDAFAPHGIHVAQVLLTHGDLADRERYLNARGAIEALLELGVVPVINENDTVAVDELRFSDNDQLAALVASLVGADLLVLMTDVEGLLDPSGKRVALVEKLEDAEAMVRPPTDDVGLGGMSSKLDAARRATRYGVPVVIGSAKSDTLVRELVAGEDVGTLFLPNGAPLASRKHWIAYALKPKGTIVIDEGAARALVERRSSLLTPGVIGVRGEFEAGDAVQIVSGTGAAVGRGLARYGVNEVARLAGARSADVERRLGQPGGAVVVHRDDLVLSTEG